MRTEIMNGVAQGRGGAHGIDGGFVHFANLIIVKRQLADPSITDEERRMLARLLALEEAKRFHEKDGGHAGGPNVCHSKTRFARR
jgi:hypothetical protein